MKLENIPENKENIIKGNEKGFIDLILIKTAFGIAIKFLLKKEVMVFSTSFKIGYLGRYLSNKINK